MFSLLCAAFGIATGDLPTPRFMSRLHVIRERVACGDAKAGDPDLGRGDDNHGVKGEK
ncbi:MAG: hypothetical protein K9J37_07900 [Saprospiraceae bacterium]|nr:hypothetical protein [Saprospiraceae bacterium]MCF8249821.1 hypothetical protein [Saprospiraceae bacterium]MCF8279509.1 hypothetical protein [Bacteroidales bacterium]MCF8311745.1 hypothetical protein [Saprospiraceae bacterium]MCF8440312.1 hypothetical protein [Saprospiraceae bacterium]